MTLNLESDIGEQLRALDELKWTKLQTEICMNVANAKYYAFVAEAERAAEYIRHGFLTRTAAADCLHTTALYNQLYFEYGRDRIQELMAVAFNSEAAA
jgi:hypothetical protein